jgi:hypothetical protein
MPGSSLQAYQRVARRANDGYRSGIDEAESEFDLGNEGIPIRRIEEGLPVKPLERLNVVL